MPRALSDKEKIQIKERLIQEAADCLLKYGVRKTTIDDLVNKVKISKGTFYLFYQTKELLFYDAFCRFHDKLLKELKSRIEGLGKTIHPEDLTELIFLLYKQVETSFIPNIIFNGEFQLLFEKLPNDLMEANTLQDDFMVEQIFDYLPFGANTDKRVISAALRGVFLTMLHKEEIGADLYDEALRTMIHGVVLQMF